jgi:hypothetical protein
LPEKGTRRSKILARRQEQFASQAVYLRLPGQLARSDSPRWIWINPSAIAAPAIQSAAAGSSGRIVKARACRSGLEVATEEGGGGA